MEKKSEELVESKSNSLPMNKIKAFRHIAAEYILSTINTEKMSGRDAFMKIFFGDSMGLHPAVSLKEIDFIKGVPTPRAKLMLARVDELYPKGDYYIKETDDKHAIYLGRQKPHHPLQPFEYNEEMARRSTFYNKKTGKTECLLDKKNWKNNPEAMYLARSAAKMCRAIFPRAAVGMGYVPEETMFFEDPKPLTDAEIKKFGKYDPNIMTVDFTEADEKLKSPLERKTERYKEDVDKDFIWGFKEWDKYFGDGKRTFEKPVDYKSIIKNDSNEPKFGETIVLEKQEEEIIKKLTPKEMIIAYKEYKFSDDFKGSYDEFVILYNEGKIK